MLSITLKRSAATLGVVAGLLAAAGPANASAGTAIGVGDDALSVKAEPAPGTQSRSALHLEDISMGVKSPTDPASGFIAPIGSDKGSLKAAGTETGNPERSGPALARSRAGAFALELEGKIVKAPASPTSVVFTSVSNVASQRPSWAVSCPGAPSSPRDGGGQVAAAEQGSWGP